MARLKAQVKKDSLSTGEFTGMVIGGSSTCGATEGSEYSIVLNHLSCYPTSWKPSELLTLMSNYTSSKAIIKRISSSSTLPNIHFPSLVSIIIEARLNIDGATQALLIFNFPVSTTTCQGHGDHG